MKKLIAVMLLAASALTFVSCGNENFYCDGCESDKVGKPHEVKIIGGTAVTMCDDCYAKYEAMINAALD